MTSSSASSRDASKAFASWSVRESLKNTRTAAGETLSPWPVALSTASFAVHNATPSRLRASPVVVSYISRSRSDSATRANPGNRRSRRGSRSTPSTCVSSGQNPPTARDETCDILKFIPSMRGLPCGLVLLHRVQVRSTSIVCAALEAPPSRHAAIERMSAWVER